MEKRNTVSDKKYRKAALVQVKRIGKVLWNFGRGISHSCQNKGVPSTRPSQSEDQSLGEGQLFQVAQ